MSQLQFEIIPVTPFEQNCSLIWDTATMIGAVVDAGGEIDRILGIAKDKGVTIEKLLVTHAHLDHASGVADLAEQLDLPIEGPHPGDQFWIDLLPQQAQQMGFPPAKPFVPTRWLDDGDVVTVGGLQLEVYHCPGHTPGHVVFYERGENLAIVGDVIFQGSIGRSDFPQGDHEQLVSSIRNKLFPLGDEVQFICGHGPMSTFGHERATNPFVADKAFG